MLQFFESFWRLDFHHQSRLLRAVNLHAKSRSAPGLGMAMLRRPLQVLWRDVATFHDDQILDATGNEQLPGVPKTKIAGSQEFVRGCAGQACPELFTAGIVPAPIAGTYIR